MTKGHSSPSEAYSTYWGLNEQGPQGPSIKEAAPPIEDNQPGFFSKMLGYSNMPIKAIDDKRYPGDYDRYFARQFQQMYGDPVALFDQPDAQTIKMSKNEFLDAANSTAGLALQTAARTASTPTERDNIVNNWIAAQKSSVSALGFDPRVTIHTPPGPQKLTVTGLYDPENDSMWYDANHEDSLVHESFHRGITMLDKAGELPKEVKSYLDDNGQELLVRAFKIKYFGDIEKGIGKAGDQQVRDAQWLLDNDERTKVVMKALETSAAKYIATKHPRGPH